VHPRKPQRPKQLIPTKISNFPTRSKKTMTLLFKIIKWSLLPFIIPYFPQRLFNVLGKCLIRISSRKYACKQFILLKLSTIEPTEMPRLIFSVVDMPLKDFHLSWVWRLVKSRYFRKVAYDNDVFLFSGLKTDFKCIPESHNDLNNSFRPKYRIFRHDQKKPWAFSESVKHIIVPKTWFSGFRAANWPQLVANMCI
jgi:hypothetical protein